MTSDPARADRDDPRALHLQARLARGAFTLDVDLRFAGHGITALFGPSGSGKTTCLRILAGLEPQAQARVVAGSQVWQDSASGRFVPTHRRALGYVFQEASLFPHLRSKPTCASVSIAHRRPSAATAGTWDWSCWASRTCSTAGPVNCPAANASAWPSRGRWRPVRACC